MMNKVAGMPLNEIRTIENTGDLEGDTGMLNIDGDIKNIVFGEPKQHSIILYDNNEEKTYTAIGLSIIKYLNLKRGEEIDVKIKFGLHNPNQSNNFDNYIDGKLKLI